MTLNYNIGSIKMYKDNIESAYQEYTNFGDVYTDVKPYLKTLIFSSMMISLNSITSTNVSQWYSRLVLCEEIYKMNVFEKWVDNDIVKIEIDPKELIKNIGLSTNSTNRSNAEWIKVVLQNHKDIEYTSAQLSKKLKKLETDFFEAVFQ
jgi:hypothetical protein